MKYIVTLIAFIATFMSGRAFGQVAYSEDFEGVTVPALPSDWENRTAGAGGWKTHTGAIASANDWIMPAHTKVAVVDDWNNASDVNNPSSLVTPVIDMSSLTTPYMYLEYYHVQARSGSNTESFIVQASTDSAKSWTTIKTLTGNPYEWQRVYIDLSAYLGEDSIMFAFTYSDNGVKLIGAGLDNIKVYDPPTNDIALTKVTPDVGSYKEYGVANSNMIIGGEVFNEGTSPITSYTVHYQAGTGPIVSDPVTGVNIAPFTSGTFNAATAWTLPSASGPNDIKVWVELTNDNNATNDSGATEITSVPFMPKKKILAEEGTGTWCGWCPRGTVFMDSVAHSATHSQSFSLVAVHNGDPMVVSAYDSKIGSLIGGYPSMVIDRRLEVDPSELFDVYAEHKDNFGYADITLTDVAASGFNYSLKVTVKPAVDLTGDYRLALVLTEDDVTGTGAGWAQENYYSFQSQNRPLVGAGLNWQQEPHPVPAEKMNYDHVARAIVPNPDGAAGSLPATMTAGANYDYTFNTTTKAFWHRYNDNMHAIVMLIRASDGHVLNSQNIVVPLGLSDIDAGINDFRVFPNPASNQAYINFSLENNTHVQVIITDAVGRTISVTDNKGMESGKHRLTIDVSRFVSGVYNVTLQTENGNISSRLSVVK
ncbi:MAG TPA: Omp28-related outer membrane protein [Flavipsychrobacter sp.]